MAQPPKRPGPPAPDPNWELELHPPAAGARNSAPESKDPLIAHALLHTEPEPMALELDLFDEFGELERATLPPPEAMNIHVAKMMAAASLIESEEFQDPEEQQEEETWEGDRPTPLLDMPESERSARAVVKAATAPGGKLAPGAKPSAPGAKPSSPGANAGVARVGGLTPQKTSAAALLAQAVPTPKPAQVAATAQAAAPSRSPTSPGMQAPARPPTSPGMKAVAPSRSPTSPGMQAPARPPTSPGMKAAAPSRSPTSPGMQAPVRPPSTPAMYAVAAGRTASSSGVQAAAPPKTASSSSLKAAAPETARAEAPREARPSAPTVKVQVVTAEGAKPAADPARLRRISSLSAIPDLPAVFAVDDAWSVDEPGDSLDLPAPAAGAPSSAPAISPPFSSGELEKAAAGAPSPDQIAAIETRFTAGDFGRALVLAEAVLEEHPGDAVVAKYAESCREMLYDRYIERLGAADHVPRLAMQHAAITGLTLDHRAGFLLSCVDGVSTVEEIIDVSAMPRLDAVRLLYELMQEGIIEMALPR